MLEYALKGRPKYWIWILFLICMIGVGFYYWLLEHKLGTGVVTGLHRDLTWGFQVGQLAFFVGAAASAVMIVLPYYFHNYKEFGKLTVLAEFFAVGMVIVSMLSVFVIMGQPERVFNVIFYATPHSMIFYDMMVLSIYLFLNLLCGWTVLHAEYKETKYPSWLKPFIYWAVLWGPSIHVVTAFLIQGLPGRGFWLTAIMAPRFLASAFSAGPALLLVLALLLKKLTGFDIGKKAVDTLAKIITYAFIINLLFICFELFTAFYSGIPEHTEPFIYLFAGLQGHSEWVAFSWASVIFAIIGLVLLVIPSTRKNETSLVLACISVVISVWIDKGLLLMIGGFTPNPFGVVVPYKPAFGEVMIEVGVWAIGFLIVTILWKIAVSVYKSKDLVVKLKEN